MAEGGDHPRRNGFDHRLGDEATVAGAVGVVAVLEAAVQGTTPQQSTRRHAGAVGPALRSWGERIARANKVFAEAGRLHLVDDPVPHRASLRRLRVCQVGCDGLTDEAHEKEAEAGHRSAAPSSRPVPSSWGA